MRKFVVPGIGGLAALAVLYALGKWLFVWRYQISTQDAYVQADIAAILTKLPGYVSSIKVTDNQTVKSWDILLELDPSDFRPKVDQARAGVESRMAAITNFDARLKLQQTIIQQARAGLISANADALRARADSIRYRDLADNGVVSKQKLDSTGSDIAKANAAVEGAAAALQAQRDQVAVLESAKVQAQADLKQSEAQLEQAEADHVDMIEEP